MRMQPHSCLDLAVYVSIGGVLVGAIGFGIGACFFNCRRGRISSGTDSQENNGGPGGSERI